MLLRSLNDLSLTQLYPVLPILAARLESIYGQLKTRRGGRAAKPICFLVIILNMSILQIFSVGNILRDRKPSLHRGYRPTRRVSAVSGGVNCALLLLDPVTRDDVTLRC